MRKQPDCCLCGQPCEPWVPDQPGWGHNPEPYGNPGDRCCNNCNDSRVIPARIQILAEFPLPNPKQGK